MSSFSGRRRITVLALLVLLPISACNHVASEKAKPVTITFIGWGPATLRELSEDQSVIERFTRETGIRVHFINGPESMNDRLQLYRQYLQSRSTTPDVYYLDIVWPGVFADDMIDLNSYLADEARLELGTFVENDTVNGRLISMPFNVEAGLLYYRKDLLAKYGYRQPPSTWDELEKMAARIQAGERAAGKRNFWGFVWQGAPYEGLTCNALEWQVSMGGGKIIESDGTISVNNPQAIQAMKRARGWVGTISPPGVVAFKEQDSRDVWDAGNAAFARDWIWRQFRERTPDSPRKDQVGIALLPAGKAGHTSVLGGQSLGISKYSTHPREAAALIRYLSGREAQMELWDLHAMMPTLREFYENPQSMQSRPAIAEVWQDVNKVITTRPSAMAGKHYDEVSVAYFSAVHSILTGEVPPEKAIADLQAKLVNITGLKSGSARPAD